MVKSDEGYLEEGDTCPLCGGYLAPHSVNCSCHISAPCNSCVSGDLKCEDCEEVFEGGFDHTSENEEY